MLRLETDAKTNGDVTVGAEVTDGSSAIIDDGTAVAKKEAYRIPRFLASVMAAIRLLTPSLR